MSKLLLIFCIFCLNLNAQVPRNIFVENFTNTRCSICASRMPGFYNNISKEAQIIQVAYHPSSPYSSCLLSQHNVTENDARTNFYGVYGGTPKVMVNAVNVSSSDLSNSAIYQSELNKTSSFLINVDQSFVSDSIISRIVIKKIAAYNATSFLWYAILVEDTIFYNAPNGEKQHYNVFRKNIMNQPISLIQINDSVVFEVKTKKHNDWQLQRMKTVSWLTEATNKTPLQVQKSASQTNPILLDSVYQNATTNTLNLDKSLLSGFYQFMKDTSYQWTVQNISLPNGWQLDSVYDINQSTKFSTNFIGLFQANGISQKDSIGILFNHQKIPGYGSCWIEVCTKNSSKICYKRKYSLRLNSNSAINNSSKNYKWFIQDQKIQFEDNHIIGKVRIYNLWGISIPIQIENSTIDLSNFTSGIYILEIENKYFKILI